MVKVVKMTSGDDFWAELDAAQLVEGVHGYRAGRYDVPTVLSSVRLLVLNEVWLKYTVFGRNLQSFLVG